MFKIFFTNFILYFLKIVTKIILTKWITTFRFQEASYKLHYFYYVTLMHWHCHIATTTLHAFVATDAPPTDGGQRYPIYLMPPLQFGGRERLFSIWCWQKTTYWTKLFSIISFCNFKLFMTLNTLFQTLSNIHIINLSSVNFITDTSHLHKQITLLMFRVGMMS